MKFNTLKLITKIIHHSTSRNVAISLFAIIIAISNTSCSKSEDQIREEKIERDRKVKDSTDAESFCKASQNDYDSILERLASDPNIKSIESARLNATISLCSTFQSEYKNKYILIGKKLKLIELRIDSNLKKSSPISASTALNWQIEVDKIKYGALCRYTVENQPNSDGGKSYMCVNGKAETVNLIVDEITGTGKLKKIEVSWEDWMKNIGEGLHADKKEAKEMLNYITSLYINDDSDRIKKIFFGTKNTSWETKHFSFVYTYDIGNGLNTHALNIFPK